MEQSFIAFLEDSIQKNWDLDALTDYKGATLQYKDVARKIEKLHIIFELSGIKKGDKIAVCGRNSSHWGVTFPAPLCDGHCISFTNSRPTIFITSSIIPKHASY